MCTHRNCLLEVFKAPVKDTVQHKSSQEQNHKHGQHMHTAHLVDVFEFVYDLADDWLRGLVASGLSAGVRLLQARPRKPDGTGRKRRLSVCRGFTTFRELHQWKT